MSSRRVRAVARGRVQGVGYRASLRLVAEREHVAGWVRNRPDGTVEAELEGATAAVDRVLAWMASGPPGASVDGTEVTEQEPSGRSGFEVR